jgi:hypothetical protein
VNPPTDFPQLAGRLKAHVELLARAPRPPGGRAHREAAQYVLDHLRQAGFTVEEARSREGGFSCVNLLTRPFPDRDGPPLVIVGAHYDSVPGSPGADDNASAVAALLELAAWLGPQLLARDDWTARIQLVAYDLEEYGMVGSYLHSRELQQTDTPVRGMISLEMLGYTDHRPGSQQLPPHLARLYPDVGNFIGVCGNEDSRELLGVVTAAMKAVDGLPVEHIAVPGRGEVLPPIRLSDHSSFWDRGYPAVMITDTSFMRNPHYHQVTDTPGTLDYRFLAWVTAGVCQAVCRLLKDAHDRSPG